MRKSISIPALAVIILAFAASCEKAQTEYSLESREIALSAEIKNITGLSVATKAFEEEPYTAYTLTTPTSDMPLYAAIWASSNSGYYPGNQSTGTGTAGHVEYAANGYVDYHNTTKFTSGLRQLLDHQLFYPDAEAKGDTYGKISGNTGYAGETLANSNVYFVGLCPRSGSWGVEGSAYNCAYTTFTGKDDVMFAPEVSKNITQTNVTPKLQFNHMLTWLCIKVKAESDEAVESWGKVKQVTVESKNRISINTQAKTVAEAATFAYESNEISSYYLPTYKVTDGEYTKTAFTGQYVDLTCLESGKTNADLDELCYVLCAPVDATDSGTEYNLRLNIGGRQGLDVPVNLVAKDSTNFTGSTAGHKFTVVLNFIVGGNVSAQGRVTAWENGGLALTQLTDGEDN